jgi:VWFA-related protein
MQPAPACRITLAVAVSWLLCLSASRPAAQQTPVIKSGVARVPITFLAVAEDGRPVPDLKREEVLLRVGSRDREIKSLEFVRLAGAPIGGADAAPKRLPLPFGSNRLLEAGRTVLLVVAHESIRPGKERPVREAAVRFLSALSPRDRVALVMIPRGRVVADFTTDHARVLTALNRFIGQGPENPSESDLLCRSRLTLQGATDLLQSITPLDGPKTVVFIASGLMPPKRDAPLTAARRGWSPGACELVARDFELVGLAAGLARAHFYLIQPDDLRFDTGRPASDAMTRVQAGGPPDPGRFAFADPSVSRFATADDELNGLQNLAGVTGGELYRLTSTTPDAAFARIARESSGYYIAAFEPDASERNGIPHRMIVRVTRERVAVRAGSQLLIEPVEAADAATPQSLLRGGGVHRGLPLRLTAYPSLDPSGSVRVLAVAEPLDPSAKLTGVSFGLFADEGRLVARSTPTADQLRASPVLATIPVAPGAYRLRVAAVDAAGRRGTADFEIDARLTDAGPLKSSGLALGVLRAGSLEPVMEFARDAVAVVYLELYGRVPRRDGLTVNIEIGETLDGPPLGTIPARVRPSAADPDHHTVMAAIPIGGLLPGDFIVRAVINIDGKPQGRVLRTLRKGNP